MWNLRKIRLMQAAIGLLSICLVSRELAISGPTEFSGGYVTGHLFRLADWGWVLFMFGLLAATKYQRIASAVFISASLLCFPIFSFIVFPGFFNRMFYAESSMMPQINMVWDSWSVLGMVSLAIVICLSLSPFLIRNNQYED